MPVVYKSKVPVFFTEETRSYIGVPGLDIIQRTWLAKDDQFSLRITKPSGVSKEAKPLLVEKDFADKIKLHSYGDTRLKPGTFEEINLDFNVQDGLILVWIDFSRTEFYSADGIPLTKLYVFGSCDASFSSGRYGVRDIKELFTRLKKHPWVVNKKELMLKEVPQYNQDFGDDRYISTEICPDQRSYQKIFNAARTHKRSVRTELLYSKEDYLGMHDLLRPSVLSYYIV